MNMTQQMIEAFLKKKKKKNDSYHLILGSSFLESHDYFHI